MKPLSLIEKAFFLKRVRLFAELDFDLLLSIAEKLNDDDYDAAEKVFMAGQVANRVYFIAQGMIQLVDERMRPIGEIGPMEVFGDESIFSDSYRGYGAICKTDAMLLTLSRSHLLAIISDCPSVAISILQAYASALACRHFKGASVL